MNSVNGVTEDIADILLRINFRSTIFKLLVVRNNRAG